MWQKKYHRKVHLWVLKDRLTKILRGDIFSREEIIKIKTESATEELVPSKQNYHDIHDFIKPDENKGQKLTSLNSEINIRMFCDIDSDSDDSFIESKTICTIY